MTREQAIESAIRDAIETALDAAGVVAAIRCWWLDDDVVTAREPVDLPSVAVVARPWVPDEGPVIGTCMVGISMQTEYQDDGKRTALAALYGAVRAAIDADEYEPEDPVTSMEGTVTDGDTFPDPENRRNVATLTVDFSVCVAEAEAEESEE